MSRVHRLDVVARYQEAQERSAPPKLESPLVAGGLRLKPGWMIARRAGRVIAFRDAPISIGVGLATGVLVS